MEGLPAPISLPKDEMKLFLKLRHQGQKLFRKKADVLPESVDFMTRSSCLFYCQSTEFVRLQTKN